MPGPLSRFRERSRPSVPFTPVPGGNSRKIGEFVTFTGGVEVSRQNVNLTSISQPSTFIERCWDQKNPGPPYRTGGPFVSVKTALPVLLAKGQGKYSSKGAPGFPVGSWMEYVGGFANPILAHDGISYASYTGSGYTSPLSPNLLPLAEAFGPQAWAKLRPDIEKASLSTFLAEFREVPRMLRTSASAFYDVWNSLGGNSRRVVMSPKPVADNFLNIQFGWLPFIGDVRKLLDALIFSRQYLADLIAGNNTWQKRKRVMVNTESRELRALGTTAGCEPFGSNIQSLCKSVDISGTPCVGTFQVYSEHKTLVWAEGSFKYYRPEFDRSLQTFDSAISTIQRYMTLFGARVNPAVLYQITPWSWLVDYFTNLGDLVQKVQDWGLDGVVARYLYVMHHQVRTIKSYHWMNFWSGAVTLEWERFIATKTRAAADGPYGFGLSGNPLTARQIAILAALGISRV